MKADSYKWRLLVFLFVTFFLELGALILLPAVFKFFRKDCIGQ